MFYFCPVDYEYFFLSFSRRREPSLKRQTGLEGQLSVLVSTMHFHNSVKAEMEILNMLMFQSALQKLISKDDRKYYLD